MDSAYNFIVLNVKPHCEFCSVTLSKFMVMFSCAVNRIYVLLWTMNFLIKFYMRQHDFYMNDTLFKLSNVSILLQFYYKMYIITKWTLILKIKLALVVYYFLQIKIDLYKGYFLVCKYMKSHPTIIYLNIITHYISYCKVLTFLTFSF